MLLKGAAGRSVWAKWTLHVLLDCLNFLFLSILKKNISLQKKKKNLRVMQQRGMGCSQAARTPDTQHSFLVGG